MNSNFASTVQFNEQKKKNFLELKLFTKIFRKISFLSSRVLNAFLKSPRNSKKKQVSHGKNYGC